MANDGGWTDVEEKDGEWKDVEPRVQVPTEAQASAVPPTAPMPQKPAALRGKGTLENPAMRQVDLMTGEDRPDMYGAPISPIGAAASYPRAIAGLASGYGAAKAVDKLYPGHPWVRDAAAIGAGALGEGVAAQGEAWAPGIKRTTIEAPKKINLPGGFKINRNVPPNPYEEMGASKQYGDMAREAGKPGAVPPNRYEEMGNAAQYKDMARSAGKVAAPDDPYAERLPLPQRAYAEMQSDLAARGEAPPPLPIRAHAEMEADIAKQGKAVPLSQSPYANNPLGPADRAQLRPAVPPRANAPAWKGAVPDAAPAPTRTPTQMPAEPPWAARTARVRANPRPIEEIAPTAPGAPRTGDYVSRMGRRWNAGDLAQMPREQLAGEYAREISRPVAEQDQEWLTALKAESQRNTKGMYPGAAASTRGGARLQPNGSSESSASAEAVNRTASEGRAGVKYFIEDARSGQRTPVSSIDVHGDIKLGPGKRIIQVGPNGESIFK